MLGLRKSVFLFIYLGAAVFLWLESSAIPVNPDYIDKSLFKFKNSANSFGAFSVYKTTAHDKKPELYLSVDGIKKENSKLGIFNTTALKKAVIKKLYFKTFISSNVNKPIDLRETSIVSSKVPHPKEQKNTANNLTNLEQMLTKLQEAFEDISKKAKFKILFPEFDLSDISEVTINDFSYIEDFNGKTLLQVTSARAYSSYKTKGLSLRGNVIVTSADGTRLQCNNLTWDYSGRTFKVNGMAILNKNKNISRFKDTVFNAELLPIESYPINARKIYRRNNNEG